MAKEQSDVMTLKEAAKYCRLHLNTVRAMAKNRLFPAAKLGNQYRTTKRIVDAWLDKQSRYKDVPTEEV